MFAAPVTTVVKRRH